MTSHRNLFTAKVGVSIHTPTKGVTFLIGLLKNIIVVSIHTPTKGVTPSNIGYQIEYLFQSTHPRRVWHQEQSEQNNPEVFQSTHPRRVWHEYSSKSNAQYSFNPHTHEGCDSNSLLSLCEGQSFNPHTHEGCDSPNHAILDWPTVSIHTPTKGVTYYYCIWYAKPKCFNPHTHEGCDKRLKIDNTPNDVSIHTPTKGVTG